jgi:membrane-associated phospholipid phosphatase
VKSADFGQYDREMTLPLFITRGNKYVAGAIMYAVAYALYYVTNHFPMVEPTLLPFTWIDQNTPFLPWTVLIYMSEYFYFAFVYILLKREDNINQYLYSYFVAQIIACFIFAVYPVTYPRELFPVPTDIPQWLQGMWAWLRVADAPTNCLPSLHVASCFLSAFAFITDKQKKLFWTFFIWSSAIAVTTLTTKQHYVVDVITGIALASATYYWFHHRQRYTRIIALPATDVVTN